MRVLSLILFTGWAGALLLLGGAGLFTGAWDLRSIFHIDLANLDTEGRGNLLNQYRFLKAIEFGFGAFCFVFRDRIFRVPVYNRLFLSIVFLGAAARALSIAVDGRPHWAFVGITILEFLTGAVIAVYTRSARSGTNGPD